MNKLVVTALLVLAAAVLFPPADFVRPATEGRRIGDLTFAGLPEIRRNEGFTFISKIGGPIQIRFTQWFVQIGAVVAISGVVILSSKKKMV
jgi:hypothetical protein